MPNTPFAPLRASRFCRGGQAPTPALDLPNRADKAAHDKLVSLVDTMLALKRQEAGVSNPLAREKVTRQIASVDTEIDAAVCALYGLTDGEIAIAKGR